MPAPKTGFGYAVMGTDAFGDEPETAAFETKIAAEFNEPIFRFVFDGRIYDDFVIDAPSVSRGGDIIAGTTNIVLSNTPIAQVHGTGIAFSDNGANADTITDSNNGFVTAGFIAQDRVTIDGSTNNDGTYRIATVAAGSLTLVVGETLTTEGAGDLVSALGQPAFNMFVEDRINNMGKPCHLGIYFNGTSGYLYLMTGTVEEVVYSGATITLSIRDAMAPMLEKRIGSGQAPADYYSMRNPFNPATIVWNVLTSWGGLDDTFTTDNTQINFTSWQAWFDRCAAHNYLVRGRFPGMTIQNMLLRVGDLTNSFIWVDGEGFFQFTMFEPPYVAGGSDATYDADNSVAIDIDIDKSTIANVINIYYGHDPDVNNNPQGRIASRRIGFANDNPDRIYLHSLVEGAGFQTFGFDTNDPVTVKGSEKNDGQYFLQTVTNTVLKLTASNGLTDEDSGASVTLSQNKDTISMQTTSLVFNDTGGNDTITDANEQFVFLGFVGTDSVTVSGSVSNDGTYPVESITAGTITLTGGVLTQESSGALVVLSQIHTSSVTATTVAFNDDEVGPGIGFDPADVDHINKSDGGLLDAGFVSQYPVTVSGSNSNDGTYRISNVTQVQMDLLNQTLANENNNSPGDEGHFVTITQAHETATSGKQFSSFVTDTDPESIALYGVRLFTDEDKLVWHDNLLSAASAAEEYLKIYKFPAEISRITATMTGWLSEIGDEIHVTEAHKNISDMTYFIKEVDIDVDMGNADILAERGR